MFKVCIAILLLAGFSNAWQCPNNTVQENFNIEKYMGAWYEIARFWYSPFESNSFCNLANYTLLPNATVIVDNRGRYGGINAKPTDYFGYAVAPDPSQPAKLEVSFPQAPEPAPLWILMTDYENYSLAWSCSDVLGEIPVQFAWILSRDYNFANTTEFQNLISYSQKIDIPIDNFDITTQQGCWN